jgi:hypothetical protein
MFLTFVFLFFLYPLSSYAGTDFNTILGKRPFDSLSNPSSPPPKKKVKENYFFGKNRVPEVVEYNIYDFLDKSDLVSLGVTAKGNRPPKKFSYITTHIILKNERITRVSLFS